MLVEFRTNIIPTFSIVCYQMRLSGPYIPKSTATGLCLNPAEGAPQPLGSSWILGKRPQKRSGERAKREGMGRGRRSGKRREGRYGVT